MVLSQKHPKTPLGLVRAAASRPGMARRRVAVGVGEEEQGRSDTCLGGLLTDAA